MHPRPLLLLVTLLTLTVNAFAQHPQPAKAPQPTKVPQPAKDELSIRRLMADQVDAWNKGNIDQFMKGYWNNDSLVFIGKAGPTYGYHHALANYKKNYNGPDQMGTLFFDLLKVRRLSPDYYFVIGKWFLKRKSGDVGGTYTLLFHKIDGQWRIIVDHTS